MNFERDDAKIGLLVLFAAGLFAALLFHRSMTTLVKKETLQLVDLQHAADVTVGTEVQLHGVRIGQVNAVALKREGVAYRITASLGLQPEITLWKGTRALVASKTFGGAFLDLQLPPEIERREVLAPGSTLPSSAAPSLGTAIEEVQNLVKNLNLSVESLRTHLEKKGAGALLDHPSVKKVLLDLDETLKGYGGLAKDAQSVVQKMDPAAASAQRSLQSLEKTLAVVEQRQGDIDTAIGSLARTLKEMEGFLGDLRGQMKTTLPETEATLKALHRNLNATEELLEILKAKPNRVIFGQTSQEELDKARKKVEANRAKTP